MGYQFRRGPIFREETIDLTDSSLRLYRGKGKAKRELAFSDIKAIHSFSNMTAINENGKRFDAYMCRLVPKRGAAITIVSTSFIRHGTGYSQVATNNDRAYIRLLGQIKERVALANPNAALIIGNRIASVLGYMVSLVAFGVLMLAALALWRGGNSMEELPLFLLGIFIGLLFVPWGFQMAKGYAPVRMNLRQAVIGSQS